MRNALHSLLLLGAALTGSGDTIADRAKAAGKGMMVFAYGSDWSASGRALHAVYRSEAFTRAVDDRYVMGTVDIRDTPTPESQAANAWAAPGDLASDRLPALFLTGKNGRGFLAWENIPIDTTAEAILAKIAQAEAIRDKAEALIAQAGGKAGAEAAELLGQALETVEPQLGTVARLTGKKGYGAIFGRIKTLDPGDTTGWQRRFTMGSGVALIAEVNGMRERKLFDKGEAIIAREEAKSDRHLTVNQRQALAMLPYALYRTEKEREKERIARLDRIAALDPTTLWGMAAVGFLYRHKAPEVAKYATPTPIPEILRPRHPATGHPAFTFDTTLAADLQT